MTDYGKVRGTIKPETIEFDDYSVWIASDIEEVSETTDEEEFNGYEYNLVQYEKNEYIKYITENQAEQINDVQLALVEIYEAMEV